MLYTAPAPAPVAGGTSSVWRATSRRLRRSKAVREKATRVFPRGGPLPFNYIRDHQYIFTLPPRGLNYSPVMILKSVGRRLLPVQAVLRSQCSEAACCSAGLYRYQVSSPSFWSRPSVRIYLPCACPWATELWEQTHSISRPPEGAWASHF